jgi:hypothetical protein
MKSREIIIQMITISFILLWSYAAFSKLVDLDKSRSEMLNQVFPMWIAEILYWLVPSIEIGLCALLVFTKTRLIGLIGSLILISSFSIYIAITMTGIFGRIPCNCGGILSHMSYGTHLIFNLFFVVLALMGISLTMRVVTFHNIKNLGERSSSQESNL